MYNLSTDEIEKLIDEAFLARENAYTPYSNFKVGASVLTANKKIYRGCNIENSSFSPTICAERTAIFTAVSQGIKDFLAICVVGGKQDCINLDFSPPCGVCRQVMVEFCDKDNFLIILAKNKKDYKIYTLSEMLPHSFSKKELNN